MSASADTAMVGDALLSVRGLRAVFDSDDGPVPAVDDVSFDVGRGETVAIVGESGSGKSVTSLAIMGLLPRPGGRLAAGQILFRRDTGAARDLVQLSRAEMRAIRGNEIAMISQEPMTALNPVFPVGHQIAEAIALHQHVSRNEAQKQAVAMLRTVGIPAPDQRARQFPHQLSGGMRQRVMIAMALSCRPALLIADEPTTALDVTIQAQILALIAGLQSATGTSVLFITHDLGVVAQIASRVVVMYAGRVVEHGTVADLFARPRHPYTRGLLASIPSRHEDATPAPGQRRPRLPTIGGKVPNPRALPPGCAFSPRCPLVIDLCRTVPPALEIVGAHHRSRCHRWREL